MILLLTFLGIGKYFIIGMAILCLLQKRGFVFSELGLPLMLLFSFLLGTSAVSLVLHIGLLTSTLYYATLFTWILCITAIIYLFVSGTSILRSFFKGSLLLKVLAISGYVAQALILSFQPVIAHDARAIWLLKAKSLFLGESSFFQHLQSANFWYSHTDYPITLPLLYADLLRFLPTYWEPAIGILSFTFFFMIIIGIFGAFKKFTSLPLWVTFTLSLVLVTTPEYLRQGWSGLSDVPLSVFFFGTLFALLLSTKDSKSLALPIIFAAIGATIKNEGQMFMVLTFLYLAWKFISEAIVTKKVILKEVLMLTIIGILALSPILLWKNAINNLSITNDVASALNFADIPTRLPLLLNEVLPRLFDGFRFGILFTPAMLLLALPNSRAVRTPVLYVLVGQAAIYLAVYLTTPHDMVWHISTSFSRLLLHLLPSVYLLALAHRSNKSIV